MSASVYSKYRAAFADALAASLNVPLAEVDSQIKPAEPPHGDFSFATFALAKSQRKAPPAIAAGLASALKVPGLEVVATGPYVNARLAAMPFTSEVLTAAREQAERYGGGDSGKGKTVCIDYSSPN